MTDLFSRSFIFRSFSSSSSTQSTSSTLPILAADSDCGSEEDYDELLNQDIEMNFLSSLASAIQKKTQQSAQVVSKQQQQSKSHQNQNQPQHQNQQQPSHVTFDIEEASPCSLSSQRLDPSRRRNHTAIEDPLANQNQVQQAQTAVDDEIKAVIVPKPPSSCNRSGLPLTLNHGSNHGTGNNGTSINKKPSPDPILIHP